MLRARVLTIAVWLPVHLAILIWGRPYHFLIYLEAISLLALMEFFRLTAAAGRRPHRLTVILGGAVYLAAIAYNGLLAWVAAGAALLTVLALPAARGEPKGALADAGASALALAYIPVLLGFLMLIRVSAGGVELLLVFFITVWLIDVAAYTCGKLFGRRHIAPAISPGKTLAGTVAGAAVGVVAPPLLVTLAFKGTALNVWWALAAGGALAAGDLAGDLAESAFKRDAGVKDAGTILAGHGGVLDRFDAVLFCAPLFYGIVLLAGAPAH
jgi:phosphatidate cytidylyltransferase